MRSLKFMLIAALVLSLGGAAYAELQSAEVNGSIRIRGNMYNWDDSGSRTPAGVARDMSFVEQRTRLGVKADFTDEVSAVIEFDSYDVWGEDFRSNYITGVDARAATGNDVEVYQAYIEAREMWGTPLQLRVGRQEISLGSEWLMGVNDTSAFFRGLSFDALRLDYVADTFTVTALWAKLAERFGDFADNDVDLYGIYGSYTGLEDVVLEAYWLYTREDTDVRGAGGGPKIPAGTVGAVFGGTSLDLHTFGLRAAGEYGAFDYEAEAAFQTGNVDRPKVFFWRDNDLDYDNWGLNLEAGYTFDMNWTPRVFLGFAFLGGENLANRWGVANRDLSFNRLFSNWEYSEFLANTDMSNMFIYRAGISAQPTEAIEVGLNASYFVADETTDLGIFRGSTDDNLGIETSLWAAYQYSDDLAFNAGWAHFFGDDGLGSWSSRRGITEPGNNVVSNGLAIFQGDDNADYDYLWVETTISF